jgi:hypothetical protein
MKSEAMNMTCAKARQMDMVEYLAQVGFTPQRISGPNHWYYSPLHNEKTASFKINRKINCWYDHGIGQGGNLIDFGIRYHQCTIKEFLSGLGNHSSLQPHISAPARSLREEEPFNQVKIITANNLQSPVLIRYLKDRNIRFDIALKYCREVHFELHHKSHLATGFCNDAGGFELRNNFWKTSSSPKTITTLNHAAKSVAVFEGFFDFLSWKVLYQQPMNFCVLNSLSFFESARPFLEQHDTIHLYLDNDPAGQNCRNIALSVNSKYKNESHLYANYKDLNEWLCIFGKSIKNKLPP